jgi:hypothetical protein
MHHGAQNVSPDDIAGPSVTRDIHSSSGGQDVKPEGPAGSVRSESTPARSTEEPLKGDGDTRDCTQASIGQVARGLAFAPTAWRANTSGIPTLAAKRGWCQVDYAPALGQ